MAGRGPAVSAEWKWPWNAVSHCVLENDDLLICSPVSLPALSSPLSSSQTSSLSLLLPARRFFKLFYLIFDSPCCLLSFLFPSSLCCALGTFCSTPAVFFFVLLTKRNVSRFHFMPNRPLESHAVQKNSPLYYQFQAQIASAIRPIHQGWHPSTLKCLYNWSILWSYLKFYMDTLLSFFFNSPCSGDTVGVIQRLHTLQSLLKDFSKKLLGAPMNSGTSEASWLGWL